MSIRTQPTQSDSDRPLSEVGASSRQSVPWGQVLFVQRRLPAYRVPFVTGAQGRLAELGVQLNFAYGEPSPAERLKRDEGELIGARRLATRYLVGRACWQPFDTAGQDLVIVSQENSLLFNHWLCRPWRQFRLAFFGHGGDLAASDAKSLSERYKRFTTRQADWWFAYTQLSRGLVEQTGFNQNRVTVLNNAVDTHALERDVAAVPAAAVSDLRARHGLHPGKTGIFIGSLYPGKGLGLLIAAARECALHDPAFRLLVVGDGQEAETVQAAQADCPWMHWAGALHGPEKARYLAAADFLLIPGSVGLAILDGFAVGLPILSTHMVGHGPEIVYLEPGSNGELTAHDPQSYAVAINTLLDDPVRLARMRAAARQSGQRYTLPAMIEAFTQGVLAALRRPSASGRLPAKP